MGFIITGNDNTVRRCAAEDVGGGVYVGGENATVEDCRFFKRRDAFMVPMYAQDDTGIQYYSPACGGLIRGDLCEGFSMAEWREFSGLDQHTLFADPLYRDSTARDFRLEPSSPNRSAGADGAIIGALSD